MSVAFVGFEMTFTDLLIIYLAFGAPLAVYKYLQNRRAEIGRRILVSSFTFFFWLPTAVEIGRLYLTNAYSMGAFVSPKNSDSAYEKLSLMRDAVSTELIKLAGSSSLHDLRDTVDRYVGLADAARNAVDRAPVGEELFEAAGREKYQLSSVCLKRRNLHRLERHHIQASADFVDLFERNIGRGDDRDALEAGIELARHLDDHPTLTQLGGLKVKRGEVWDSDLQKANQTIAAVPSISMTASLNSD